MKKMLLILIMFAFSGVYAEGIFDEPGMQANIAYDNKDYDKAFRLYFMLAREKTPKFIQLLPQHQNRLAYMYKHGQGTKKNIGKAIRWYQISANNNSVSSMSALGNIYFYGNDTTINFKKAYSYYKKAEGQIRADSWGLNEYRYTYVRYDNMGWMDLHGNGVNKDYDLAYKHFKNSVYYNENDGYSYYMLGLMCEQGFPPSRKVKLDLALEFYNKAADKGYKKGTTAVVRLMESME